MVTVDTALLANFLGLVAAGIFLFSMLIKEPRKTILTQVPADGLMAIHFFMLGSMIGTCQGTLATVRDVFMAYMSKGARRVIFLVYTGFVVSALSFTYSAPMDVLPVCGTIMGSLAMIMRDHFYRYRATIFLGQLCWLTFALSIGSWSLAMLNITTIVLNAYKIRQVFMHERKAKTPVAPMPRDVI